MVQECEFDYGNGRRCRRVPKRGEIFCRDHRRGSAQLRSEFPAAASASAHHRDASRPHRRARALPPLGGLDLDELILHIAASLQALEPLVRSSASSSELLLYQRARTAAGFAIERVDGQATMLRQALPDWPLPRLQMLVSLIMFAAPVPHFEKALKAKCLPTTSSESTLAASPRAPVPSNQSFNRSNR